MGVGFCVDPQGRPPWMPSIRRASRERRSLVSMPVGHTEYEYTCIYILYIYTHININIYIDPNEHKHHCTINKIQIHSQVYDTILLVAIEAPTVLHDPEASGTGHPVHGSPPRVSTTGGSDFELQNPQTRQQVVQILNFRTPKPEST